MKIDREVLAELPGLLDPDEEPLATGGGKIAAVDRMWVADHAATGGTVRPGIVDANWVATTQQLHYIAPRIGRAISWPWTTISLRLISRGRIQSTVAIEHHDGAVLELVMARSRAADLVTVGNRLAHASRRTPTRTAHQADDRRPPIDMPGPARRPAATSTPSSSSPAAATDPTTAALHAAGDLAVAADLWLRRHRDATRPDPAVRDAADLTRRAAAFVAGADLTDPAVKAKAVDIAGRIKAIRTVVTDRWQVTIDKHGTIT